MDAADRKRAAIAARLVEDNLRAIERKASEAVKSLQCGLFHEMSERDALRKVGARCMSIAGVCFARMGMSDEDALALVREKLPAVMQRFRKAQSGDES